MTRIGKMKNIMCKLSAQMRQREYNLKMELGGDICIHIADSLHCIAKPTQHCKAIILQ